MNRRLQKCQCVYLRVAFGILVTPNKNLDTSSSASCFFCKYYHLISRSASTALLQSFSSATRLNNETQLGTDQ